MVSIATLIWLVTITIDLYTDTRKKVNHNRGMLLRVPSMVAICILVPWQWWGIFAFAYWAVFNAAWNIIKHLPWYRKGTTSWTDRNIPVWVPWVGLVVAVMIKIYEICATQYQSTG